MSSAPSGPSQFQASQPPPEALKNAVATQQVVTAAGAGGMPQPVVGGGTAPFQYPPNMVFASPDPGALVDDQPTYVNPKQYARILKRRESRKKQTGTDVTSYTPRKRSYMHESRHKHAMQRRRGPGGRFLSKQERADLNKEMATAAAAAAATGADEGALPSGGDEHHAHHALVGATVSVVEKEGAKEDGGGGAKET